MSIGVCYFPEHWPREEWTTDVQRMAAAGIEYVRMGEFSWARLEPRRGEFEFEWLDAAVELIADHDMQAVLCTPTATPPKWLVDERPGILQEEPDGTIREFGSRRHYCFNAAPYREETERIVREVVDRYAGSPAVAGWQTDNEFGCHGTIRCYCDDCAAAFREWLRDRYGDVETLNDSWGTTFWSQRHDDFGEVDPPGPTVAEHHPSRLLDYYRFSSASAVEYNRFQTELIRECEGGEDGWFVTHNFMGQFPSLDAYDASEPLDFLAWDSYPTGFVQDRRQGEPTRDELRAGDPDQVSLNHDLYRGAKRRPFWVMEQQPGDVNWPPYAPQPGEGAMRLWAHHAVAHGADAVLYFRWRRCREGQEQYHAGLCKHDGSPDRGYHDAERTATELETHRLADLAPVDAPVALLHDYDDLWAQSIQPHAPDYDYWTHLDAYYGALRAASVQVDVVHPASDLDGYEAVVAPTLHLAGEDIADHLESYVSAGGQLLLGARSGLKDPANKLDRRLAPGALADLVGATVDQHESLPPSLETAVTLVEDGTTYDYRTWAEWLEPRSADVLAEHAGGVGDGRPAAVERDLGDGDVCYCGVWPGRDMADVLVRRVLARAGVDHTDRLPDGVRMAERDGHTWITNFTSQPRRVNAPDGDWILGDGTLEPFGVAVAASAPTDLELRRH